MWCSAPLIYIDEANLLVRKTKSTTKENGTYELELTYGKYASYSLPDKIIFSFNTKDYKLPKGVTFDFDDGSAKKPVEKEKNKKGRAEIVFSSYKINQGVADDRFSLIRSYGLSVAGYGLLNPEHLTRNS